MESNNHTVTGMMKSEYSRLSGIPPTTLARYMNKLYFDALALMDYTKSQKHLTPKQISYLNTKLVVTFSE